MIKQRLPVERKYGYFKSKKGCPCKGNLFSLGNDFVLLNQHNPMFITVFHHPFWPYSGLYLTNMCFSEKIHTQS